MEKKTGHASEQDRPDIVKRREAWFDSQLDLDPKKLVFIDDLGEHERGPQERPRSERRAIARQRSPWPL
ncbi:MAG: hypothetical protein ACR652_24000 [Methylocystis sp.]|uniref:hypothetical protein n=1 Tax=Methylocystis sp. TaxID=1911079 RepID=UPI003DA23266